MPVHRLKFLPQALNEWNALDGSVKTLLRTAPRLTACSPMNKPLTLLVTGGAGYIGSHTALALLQAGHSVVVLDNLCNATAESLKRVAQLAGRAPVFVKGDIRDRAVLDRLFAEHAVDAVLHFAGLKAVGESVAQPLRYYDNNVHGSQVLLQACADAGVFNVVFSSSATVYGEPAQMPIAEACPVGQPTNPYGRSKLMVEDMLRDVAASDPRWRIAILRYFNPVGAHESGQIGEDPNGIPNNLLPYIAQVAVGKLPELAVFGNDYPTPDGTGVRDYIHVLDLAEGHLRALEALQTRSGAQVWNLGTGQGYSVLDMVRAFEAASGKPVPYRVAPRRPGDIATCYADPAKAERELGWTARRSLDDMMRDAWRWQRMNPDGYR
jgi:UDP-glucose 4-epimerase